METHLLRLITAPFVLLEHQMHLSSREVTKDERYTGHTVQSAYRLFLLFVDLPDLEELGVPKTRETRSKLGVV